MWISIEDIIKELRNEYKQIIMNAFKDVMWGHWSSVNTCKKVEYESQECDNEEDKES